MSTPERPQDPGEHGYGGTKQDFPTDDDSRDKEHRLEHDDDRSSEPGEGEDVRQGGWPPDPEPDPQVEPDAHDPNDDELIKKLTGNPDPNETDEDEPIPSG
jgi:hypothetical protein